MFSLQYNVCYTKCHNEKHILKQNPVASFIFLFLFFHRQKENWFLLSILLELNSEKLEVFQFWNGYGGKSKRNYSQYENDVSVCVVFLVSFFVFFFFSFFFNSILYFHIEGKKRKTKIMGKNCSGSMIKINKSVISFFIWFFHWSEI